MTNGATSSATQPCAMRCRAASVTTATPYASMDHRCAIRKAEESAMDQQPSGREDYVRKVLEAYRNTPGTCGNLRRPDRLLAIQLYQRGVPLHTVENALVLAAVRRLIRR